MSTGLSRPRKVTVEMPVISHAEQQAQQQQKEEQEKGQAQAPAPGATNVDGNMVLPLTTVLSQNTAQTAGIEISPTVQTTNIISSNAAENLLPNSAALPNSASTSTSTLSTMPFDKRSDVQPAAPPIASVILNSHPPLDAATASASPSATGLIPLASLTNGMSSKEGDFEEQSRTAIFRPESAEEWRKALKKAGQAAGIGGIAAASVDGGDVEEQDREGGQSAAGRTRSDTLMSNSSSTSTVVENDSDHKVWKARRALRAWVSSSQSTVALLTYIPARQTPRLGTLSSFRPD